MRVPQECTTCGGEGWDVDDEDEVCPDCLGACVALPKPGMRPADAVAYGTRATVAGLQAPWREALNSVLVLLKIFALAIVAIAAGVGIAWALR